MVKKKELDKEENKYTTPYPCTKQETKVFLRLWKLLSSIDFFSPTNKFLYLYKEEKKPKDTILGPSGSSGFTR